MKYADIRDLRSYEIFSILYVVTFRHILLIMIVFLLSVRILFPWNKPGVLLLNNLTGFGWESMLGL